MSQASRPTPDADAQALQQGISLHREGRLAEAAAIYQLVLSRNPTHADAMHLLGAIAMQSGDWARAGQLIEQAVAVNPSRAEFHLNLGQVYKARGDLPRAEEALREAVRLAPASADARHVLGLALAAAGKWAEAATAHAEAVRLREAFPEAYLNRGLALARQGKVTEAIACYRRALELRGNYAAAWQNLGAAWAQQGELNQAVDCFRKAASIRPGEEAYANLGAALKRRGDIEEAAACFQRAAEIRPDFALAYVHGGIALRELGRLEQSAQALRRAAELQDKSAEVWVQLGVTLALLEHVDEAGDCFERALTLDASNANAHRQLARVKQYQGRPDEELQHLEQAMRVRPSDELRVEQALVLPTIYTSLEDLRRWRERLVKEIDRLEKDGIRVDTTRRPVCSPFGLAYQGYGDRELQQRIASLFSAPRLTIAARSARPDGRIRIGFISRYLCNHTIGRLNRGLIASLSRREFEVIVLSIGPGDDAMTRLIRASADAHVRVPETLPEARRVVAELGLDVLFFTDVGMEPTTYTLALSRLAPLQCATWGHPITTGMPTVDYFISSELLETGPEARDNYTERLAQLKNLAVYYHRPPEPTAKREDFAAPQDKHWYACPQTLYKLHPEFDELIARILRGDPQGVLVLVEGRHRHWGELLRQRWVSVMPDVADRIIFLKGMSQPEFVGLCAVSDVLLDPMHFGGGNTSFEALGVGTPIVTLPSSLLRGRITLALYRKMGVMDCVAGNEREYVQRALQLGTNPDYRREISERIRSASGVLFENADGVRDLEAFLAAAVRAWP